mmetsp:Transcript_49019/g.120095  ORF Transcript_49019/g.120095 Transcript_49019/m.120095 type:complete len:483 (+) Transcript_49019:258-1706(+)
MPAAAAVAAGGGLTADEVARAEVKRIAGDGEPRDRINVVLMGDGYTESEKEKFWQDMDRLTNDMFEQDTFQSYLPLFIVWGVFIASRESGIGTHSRPRDTTFQLYRQGTQLRGVFTNRPQAARDACKLTGANACDFPSLVGNDDYYGGLGGEFVIGTRSTTSGTVVIRHEFGHNFGRVGEEYDDGQVYSGANSDTRLPPSIKWQHWVTEPSRTTEQRVVQRLGAYPWHDLAQGPRTFSFTSDGKWSRWMLRFTASGVPNAGDLVARLDGVELRVGGAQWGLDRSFWVFGSQTEGLTSGTHRLEFMSGSKPGPNDPIQQLCSLTLHEYAAEPDFHWRPEYIGAYPTWSVSGRKTYRPTNEACLMRNMTSTKFAAPCLENMMLRFVGKTGLIDGVDVDTAGDDVRVTARVVQLGTGAYRPADAVMRAVWTRDGAHVPRLDDTFQWSAPNEEARGAWGLTVHFETPEVRKDPSNVLTDTAKFTVP